MIGDFEVVLVSNTPDLELVSTATLNTTNPDHNGTVLSCLNVLSPSPIPEEMASITIIVKGKLSHTMIKHFYAVFSSIWLLYACI